MLNIISYSIGAFLGFSPIRAFWLGRDIVQMKRTVLHNYSIIGHFHHFLETQDEFFRQYS